MATNNYELRYTHEEAKEAVIKNANLFYNGKQTEINDQVYDALLELIKKDEPDFNIYEHITYSDGIDGLSVPHEITFREFDKAADIDSIDTEEKFNNWKKDYVILPKFDGSSTVTYLNKDGSIKLILSRSNDITGFVNTDKLRAKYAEAMEHRANFDLHGSSLKAVLAEAIVTAEKGGRFQANGCINSKYKQAETDALLSLMPFDAVLANGLRVPNLYFEITNYEQFSYLRDNGEIKNELGTVPCDGVVMYHRNLNYPRLVIKKLYATEKKESTITNIQYDVSWNSGIFHPVAVFEPITLENSEVKKATLFNYQNVIDSKIARGAKVKVALANMTIPQILEVTQPVETPDPVYCPYCDNPKEADESKRHKLVPFGIDVVCENPSCPTWLWIIQTRLAQRYIENPDAYLDLIENDYSKIHLGMVNDMREDWYEDLHTPEGLLTIAKLPRLGTAKFERIKEHLKEYKYDNFQSLVDDIEPMISWAQLGYLNIILPKIEFISSKLREYSNGN